MRVRVPAELVAFLVKWYGEAGRSWVDAYPVWSRSAWTIDGSPMNGAWGLIVPVVREDGVRAVVKLAPQFEEHIRSEPLALRAWNGNGAVRLLESDPRSGSMLLD